MKVALISPGVYSYGVMVIGGVLKERGDEVHISKRLELNEATGAECVGLSINSTIHLLEAQRFVSQVKQTSNPFIVVGGPVSQVPELVFKCLPEVDAVVVGEGEETTPQLLQAHTNHTPLETIPGLALKRGEEVVRTPPRENCNLDERPLPLIPPDLKDQNIRSVNTCIETHRGCLGNCAFCQEPIYFGRHIRSRRVENIVREVKNFVDMGVRKLAMGTATATQYGWVGPRPNDEAFERLLREVSAVVGKENLKVPDVRIDMITERTLRAIKQYTVGYVSFGLESGSGKILGEMRKGTAVRKMVEATDFARKFNLGVVASFIVGYPGETEADYEATKSLVEELKLDDHSVNIALPIPGTRLAQEILETPLEENPVFIKDEGKLGRLHDLSVAEARAFDLMLTGLCVQPRPLPVTEQIYSLFLDASRQQGEHVKAVTFMLRKYLAPEQEG